MNVYSPVNLVPYLQLNYLLAAVFYAATAFGSNEIERPSRSGGSVRTYTCIFKISEPFNSRLFIRKKIIVSLICNFYNAVSNAQSIKKWCTNIIVGQNSFSENRFL